MINQNAYTKFSFIMLVYAIAEEAISQGGSKLFPFLYFNYVGLVLSFHVSLLMDTTSFNRLAESMNLSIHQFCWVNLLTHVLPLLISARLTFTTEPPQGEFIWLSGLVTSSIHLSWALITTKGLNLSGVYVNMKHWQWYVMWASAITGHLLSSTFFFLCSYEFSHLKKRKVIV